jgi:SWIM zinc finger
MSLSTKLSRFFSSAIQKRGRSYFLSGVVRITQGTEHSVQATVRGSSSYLVNLSYDQQGLNISCTCPYFDDSLDPCKHLWATILAAEARGFLGAVGDGPVKLLMDGESFFEGEEGEEEFYELDEGDEGQFTSPVPYRTPQRSGKILPYPSKQKAPKPPSWQQQLISLSQAMTGQASPRAGAWPAGREIYYVVDVPATMVGQGLTVEVMHR